MRYVLAVILIAGLLVGCGEDGSVVDVSTQSQPPVI